MSTTTGAAAAAAAAAAACSSRSSNSGVSSSKQGNFRDSMVLWAKQIQHRLKDGLDNIHQVGAPSRHSSSSSVPTSTSAQHRQLAEEARRRSSAARSEAQQRGEGQQVKGRERRSSNSDLAVAMRQRGGIQRRPPAAVTAAAAAAASNPFDAEVPSSMSTGKAADDPIEIEMLPMSRSKPTPEGSPALTGRGVLDGIQTFLSRGAAGVGAQVGGFFDEALEPRALGGAAAGAAAAAAAAGGEEAGEKGMERNGGSLQSLATPSRRRSSGGTASNAALLRDSDAVTALKHRFAAWSSSDADAEQVRMTSMQILRTAPADSPTGGMAPTQVEVSCIIEGVEVTFEVLCSPRDDSELLRNFAEVDILMSCARTQCRWPSAASFVQGSIEATRGRQLEDFLTCLLNKFLADSLAKTPAESRRGSLEGTAGSQQATRHCSSIDEKSWAVESYSPNSLDSRSSDSAADSEDETTVEQSLGDAWAKWCMERPPLLRFQHASKDLAWEFPLSKAEKQELLLLQVCAQEEQNRRDMEEAQRRRHSRLSQGTVASTHCEDH